VTLSPEPPGIFRFGLAPAGTGPGPVGRLLTVTPAVCKAAAALKVRPRRALSSIAASTPWAVLISLSIRGYKRDAAMGRNKHLIASSGGYD
jgi:hypothetical protein